ncbi:MAG: penicillin-binding protein activator LpoB [candidate division Zixibacteria bacterium]|nr:penicillin-binding protein activator LpoB [candidate division Zixibacteria bacterium]
MKSILVLFVAALMVVGCSSSKQVTRLDAGTTTDLSGNWNDTDARLVAEEMISDCLTKPWSNEFAAANGRKPVVTVGRIRNNSSEHIDTETFTKDFERELINSGKVNFVASPEQRMDVRSERQDQIDWASAETRKRLREEIGADFILLGSVKSISDQEGGKQVMFYQTDLELVNVESNLKVWIGTNKIKKGISQGKTKW